MSNFNKHVKSDKIKWIATGIALVFISLIIVGVCLQVFGKGKVKPSEWFKKDETKTEQTDKPETDASAGLIVTPSESKSGMKLNIQKAAANTSAQSEANTYTVTATVLPSYADDKSVDWSLTYAPVTFQDPETKTEREVVLTDNEEKFYFVGEDPSDSLNLMWDSIVMKKLKWIKANPDPTAFVSATPLSDGSASVTITCLQPFRERILLAATLRSYNTVKAVCTLDHYAYVIGAIIDVQSTINSVAYDEGLVYEYSPSASSRSGYISIQLSTTLYTDIAYDLQFATISKVRLSETAEYIAELNKTDLFTSPVSARTKVLTVSGNNYRAIMTGNNFPLSLASSSSYNLTTDAARRSAMCLALRNLGDKPFFMLEITYNYTDAAVSKLGLTKTHTMNIPFYADLDSLNVAATNVSLDNTDIVF